MLRSSMTRALNTKSQGKNHKTDKTKQNPKTPAQTPNTFFIKVYGCLFNVADAERIKTVLLANGLTETKDFTKADVIILVTCSVREKAEHKVMDWGNKIKKLDKKPTIVLTGCMVRRDYLHESFENTKKRLKTLKNRMPWIDIFMDITNLEDLSKAIKEPKKYKFSLALKRNKPTDYLKINSTFTSDIYAYIPIMSGCDQFCTYCIVPHTRGKEMYRSYDQIIKEAKNAIKNGKKIIILLGQIIDKWHDTKANKEFHDLLQDIANLPGEFFVGFTSPHPVYMKDQTLEIIAKHPKVFKHLGLPLQAGSNRVLKAMNRPYTRKQYIEIAQKAKKIIPNLYLTTDIIVGFPPEDDKDFEQTLDIVNKLKFNKIFFAKYSPRFDNRPDAKLAHDPTYQKQVATRFNKLNELANKIFAKLNEEEIGKIYKAVYVGDNQAISERFQLVDIVNTNNFTNSNNKPQNGSKTLASQNNKSQTTQTLQTGSFIKIKIIDGGRRGVKAKILEILK